MGPDPNLTPLPRLKAGRSMRGLDHEHLAQVTRHPWQLENLATVERLLKRLDACKLPADLYEFQQDLFAAIYTIELRRAGCSKAAKRVQHGKAPQADAPDLPAGADPSDVDSWDTEVFVAERVARQLRSVGDGLAWKAFEYDRRPIYALSRNEPSGPMVGKAGLDYELRTVEALWNEEQHFGLLHDLTTCLRISDVTEFDGNRRIVHEVKKKPGRTVPTQKSRAQAAIDAITDGGPLPGPDEDTRLTVLNTGFRSDLRQLGDLIRLARERGVQGIRLTEGRMVFASSLFDVLRLHHQDIDAAFLVRSNAWAAAIKRAHIGSANLYLIGTSGDRAGRSPIAAPMAIFPLTAADRAALICDRVTLQIVMSSDVLVSLLQERGLTAEIQPYSSHKELRIDTEVLHVRRGSQGLGVTRVGLDPLLFEAMRPSAWCDGIVELFSLPKPPAHPALIWSDDTRTWR